MEQGFQSRIFKTTTYLVFVVLVTVIVVEAKLFLYPIALGILFAYLLYPIASFFETKLKFPRILSNLTALVLAMAFLYLMIDIFYLQFKIVIGDLPGIKRKIFVNLSQILIMIEDKTGVSTLRQKEIINDFFQNFMEGSRPALTKLFSATSGTIVRIGLLPVFVFFMLYYRNKAHDFLMMITKPESQTNAKNVIKQISHVTKQYMGGVFIVVMILIVLNSLGLHIIGLEYPLFFGIISAVCNFIPYFGTILGFAFPLAYSLVASDSLSTSFGVVIVFFIIQFTENNILTPNIVGNNVKLNPFIIILSLIISAMVWGIPGMLVVVPTMAVLRIIFEHTDKYKPYAFLLGSEGTEKHAITFDKIKSLFKKKNPSSDTDTQQTSNKPESDTQEYIFEKTNCTKIAKRIVHKK